MNEALKKWLTENVGIAATADDTTFSNAAQQALADGKLTGQKLAELLKPEQRKNTGPNSREVFGGVRVKAPSETYSHTKTVGKHVRTGQPVRDERGREAMLPSQLEYAKAGALFKL